MLNIIHCYLQQKGNTKSEQYDKKAGIVCPLLLYTGMPQTTWSQTRRSRHTSTNRVLI